MRFLGIQLPDQKRVEIALTAIFGIGVTSSRAILNEAGIDFSVRTKDLTPDDINKIKTAIESNYRVGGELRQYVRKNIGRLQTLETYRGKRHTLRLPVRGQSTKRNSRTIRGYKRRTAGSGKKKLTLK